MHGRRRRDENDAVLGCQAGSDVGWAELAGPADVFDQVGDIVAGSD
ncbi:hypothetical protein AB0C34_29460 [Nocardia sp. NPDC049220]